MVELFFDKTKLLDNDFLSLYYLRATAHAADPKLEA